MLKDEGLLNRETSAVEQINKVDAILHIDIYCYGCKKLVAYSYTIEKDGRRYCQRCTG